MAATNNICGVCFRKATRECAGCHNIRYCSRECQKDNWPVHKHLCKTFANFAPPPGPNLRRIIILPQDSKKPHFAWLKTFSSDTEEPRQWFLDLSTTLDARPDIPYTNEAPGYELSNFEEVFGPSTSGFQYSLQSGTFMVDGDPIIVDRSTHVFFDESQPRHTRKPNQCLLHLLGERTDILRGNHGKGNMAICTMTNVCKPKFIRDADCFDLSLGHAGLAHYFQHSAGDGRLGNIPAKLPDIASSGDSTTSSNESSYENSFLSRLVDVAGSLAHASPMEALLSRMKHMFGDELAGKLEQQFKEDQEREERIQKEAEGELQKKKEEYQGKE